MLFANSADVAFGAAPNIVILIGVALFAFARIDSPDVDAFLLAFYKFKPYFLFLRFFWYYCRYWH